MTRVLERIAAAQEAEQDARDLQGIELACEVADAWVRIEGHEGATNVSCELRDALDRLEAVTRPSALRKVRP